MRTTAKHRRKHSPTNRRWVARHELSPRHLALHTNGAGLDRSAEKKVPMRFTSILFPAIDRTNDLVTAPEYFSDLNCDQIVETITAGKEDYKLKPFFYNCAKSIPALQYRQAVFRDLEDSSLFARVAAFSQEMRDMRQNMTRVNKLHYKEQQEAWFLDAVERYCNSVIALADDLSEMNLSSTGFIEFRNYLFDYVASTPFTELKRETRTLKAELATITYSILINGDTVTVRNYNSRPDFSVEVGDTFEKFAQGESKSYLLNFKTTEDMNHIEAKILEFVASLNREIFSALEDYCRRNAIFLDKAIASFDREIQFYVSYLEYIARLKRAGLPFCYPEVSERKRDVYGHDCFDMALGQKLIESKAQVVCNDFQLTGGERVLVVSGPNQGGKTTFARMFGQLHHFAKLGCPIPGRAARLLFFDRIFTQFEREEKVENLRGKLEDDLVRMRRLLTEATEQSIIVLNEVFTSTTLQDEIFLSSKVMNRVIKLGALCVWVTFVDELASFASQTVSMISTVVPKNPALRTFKIIRRPADGLAYAMAIAQKYAVTYDSIKMRMGS